MAELDAPQYELIDFHYPDFGVKLRNGIKVGRKAVQGISAKATQYVRQLTMPTRWAVGADHIVNHQVQYFVIDGELDVITDSMVLWSGMPPSPGGFGACWPLSAKEWAPAAAQPRMELVSRERAGRYVDCIDSIGRIPERYEAFQVPTVERERVLYNSKFDIYARIPTADMAFTASI